MEGSLYGYTSGNYGAASGYGYPDYNQSNYGYGSGSIYPTSEFMPQQEPQQADAADVQSPPAVSAYGFDLASLEDDEQRDLSQPDNSDSTGPAVVDTPQDDLAEVPPAPILKGAEGVESEAEPVESLPIAPPPRYDDYDNVTGNELPPIPPASVTYDLYQPMPRYDPAEPEESDTRPVILADSDDAIAETQQFVEEQDFAPQEDYEEPPVEAPQWDESDQGQLDGSDTREFSESQVNQGQIENIDACFACESTQGGFYAGPPPDTEDQVIALDTPAPEENVERPTTGPELVSVDSAHENTIEVVPENADRDIAVLTTEVPLTESEQPLPEPTQEATEQVPEVAAPEAPSTPRTARAGLPQPEEIPQQSTLSCPAPAIPDEYRQEAVPTLSDTVISIPMLPQDLLPSECPSAPATVDTDTKLLAHLPDLVRIRDIVARQLSVVGQSMSSPVESDVQVLLRAMGQYYDNVAHLTGWIQTEEPPENGPLARRESINRFLRQVETANQQYEDSILSADLEYTGGNFGRSNLVDLMEQASDNSDSSEPEDEQADAMPDDEISCISQMERWRNSLVASDRRRLRDTVTEELSRAERLMGELTQQMKTYVEYTATRQFVTKLRADMQHARARDQRTSMRTENKQLHDSLETLFEAHDSIRIERLILRKQLAECECQTALLRLRQQACAELLDHLTKSSIPAVALAGARGIAPYLETGVDNVEATLRDRIAQLEVSRAALIVKAGDSRVLSQLILDFVRAYTLSWGPSIAACDISILRKKARDQAVGVIRSSTATQEEKNVARKLAQIPLTDLAEQADSLLDERLVLCRREAASIFPMPSALGDPEHSSDLVRGRVAEIGAGFLRIIEDNVQLRREMNSLMVDIERKTREKVALVTALQLCGVDVVSLLQNPQPVIDRLNLAAGRPLSPRHEAVDSETPLGQEALNEGNSVSLPSHPAPNVAKIHR